MDKVDNRTVSQAIVTRLHNLETNNVLVIGFVSDNAVYCKKANNDVLKNLFPNSVHLCLLAHIMIWLGRASLMFLNCINFLS